MWLEAPDCELAISGQLSLSWGQLNKVPISPCFAIAVSADGVLLGCAWFFVAREFWFGKC